jgi:hypothetical protein
MGEIQPWSPLPPESGQPSVFSARRRQPKHLSIGLPAEGLTDGREKINARKTCPNRPGTLECQAWPKWIGDIVVSNYP